MNTKGLFFCCVLMVSISTSIFCMEDIDKDGETTNNVEQTFELIKPWLGKQFFIEGRRLEAQQRKTPVMIELDSITNAICNSNDDITLYLDGKSGTLSYELFFKILNDLQDLQAKEKAGNLPRPPQSQSWQCIAS